nr:CGNR zinc finger domain-containing protein [Streptomyces sp. SID4913]
MVDLANALRGDPALPREALAELLARHGERPEDLTATAFSTADAERLRAAVLRVARILTLTDTDRAALTVNELLAGSDARPRLSRHDGHSWHLHLDRGEDSGWDDWFTASSALALAQIISENGRATWGECAAPNCANLYLGTGPGAAQRYCSTTCASRTRVAAHRRRKRDSP